jgi:hypothetical protein
MSTTMQLVPFANLIHKSNGDAITAVEGTIMKLYEVIRLKKDGSPMPYPKQNGVLKEDGTGTEHNFTLGDESKWLEPYDNYKGKKVRFTSSDTKHGIKGVKMDVNEYNGKVTRSIYVTSAANTEFAGGSGVSTPQNNSTRSTASTVGNTGGSSNQSHGRMGAQVGNAINNATLLLVHGIVKADGEPMENLKAVALQILALADELEKAPSHSKESIQMGWKDAVSPSGNRLGDLPEDKRKAAIKWAFGEFKPSADHAGFHAQVLLMAAELQIDQTSLLVEAGGDAEGLEKIAQRDMGKSLKDMEPEDWANVYKRFDAMVKQSAEIMQEDEDQTIPF